MSSPSSQRRPDVLTSHPSSARQPSLQHEIYQLDRRRLRRSSTASIASSIGGTLDTAAQNSSDLSQNAISSLLSHPIVRTGLVPQSALSVPSGHRAPSVRDIPPVNLTHIPHVESSAFQPYLASVGNLFEQYQRSKAASEDAAMTLSPRPPPRESSRPDYFGSLPSPSGSEPATPIRASALLSPPESPSSPRRAPGTPRRKPYGPTPLSTIPKVYFEETFHLENPRTFDVVSERSDVIPPDPVSAKEEAKLANGSVKTPQKTGRKALHTNAILQEKLSWYLDTVEVHLIQSIAMASSSFFAALGSLKDLQSEATESIEQIRELREVLAQLDKEMALGGLQVVKMKRRRENLGKLGSAVKQLCDVMEEATACEDLVEQGSLDTAMARLDALEDLIAGKPSVSDPGGLPKVDLRKLKALDGLAEGISQLRIRIGKGFEASFINALLADLRQHIDSVPPRETMQRWANTTLRSRGEHNRAKSTVPAYTKTNERLRPELLAALAGLNRLGQSPQAAVAYRETVMKEIKSLIRRYLPSSSDDDTESVTSVSTRGGARRLNQQEKSAILARNLRSLDPDTAEELIVKVFTAVGEALRRISVQVKVVLDVTSSFDQPADTKGATRRSIDGPPIQSNQMHDEVTQALDMSSLLGQAVDVIQSQITKVLKVRSEQHASLDLQHFLRYFVLNRLFTDECEAVSSRGGEALKEVINSQVRDFLSHMAESERQRMLQTLESDQWDAKDFPPSEQGVLDRVLESMNRTPKAWSNYTTLWDEDVLANGAPVSNGSSITEQPAKSRFAKVEEQSFILVLSTISALHGIDHYLNLIAAIPSMTADCSVKLLEYLKTFNSRSCQLILGAGATKSAGLKNITTKHLALASQTCSFFIALVPYMREFVRRQAGASASGVLPEFDKVKRSFQDHQNSIHEKLVDIMVQRCNVHIKSMEKVDWDSSAPQDTTNAYVETLAKETGTLHRVLGRHVAEIDLQMIMMPIFEHYKQAWTTAFGAASVKTEAGKKSMIRDLEYLDTKFAKIETAGNFAKDLISLVQSKDVQVKPAPPAPAEAAALPEKTAAVSTKADSNPTQSTLALSNDSGTASVSAANNANGTAAEEPEGEVMFEFTEPVPETTEDQSKPEEATNPSKAESESVPSESVPEQPPIVQTDIAQSSTEGKATIPESLPENPEATEQEGLPSTSEPPPEEGEAQSEGTNPVQEESSPANHSAEITAEPNGKPDLS